MEEAQTRKIRAVLLYKKLNAPIKQEELIECGLDFSDEKFKFWVETGKLSDEKPRVTELL